MKATAKGQLKLSNALSPSSKSAIVLDDLKTGMLISPSHLCDDYCMALFTKHDVKITKKDKVIILGRHEQNGLWSIPIVPMPAQQANGILRLNKTKKLVNYHHASLGSPTKSTLLAANCWGHLTNFPGLTTKLISKHLSPTIATALGHQDQEAKNLRPNKPSMTEVTTNQPDMDLAPAAESHTNIISSMVFSTESFHSYSD